MKKIYYPNFEPTDIENSSWIKYALLYVDSFSPIVPQSGNASLSNMFKKLEQETNLIGKVKFEPTYEDGDNATKASIKYFENYFSKVKSKSKLDNTSVKVNYWKDKNNFNSTLFEEKYTYEWVRFCEKHGLALRCNEGVRLPEEFANIYMTFLAREISNVNSGDIITDRPELNSLLLDLRCTKQDNLVKNKAIEYAINLQLPKHISEIDLNRFIELRAKPRFLETQRAFLSEIKLYINKCNIQALPTFNKSTVEVTKEYTKIVSESLGELVPFGIDCCNLYNGEPVDITGIIGRSSHAVVAVKGVWDLFTKPNSNSVILCKQYLTNIRDMK